MSDQKIHVRPAGPGDRDQVWPLARDLAPSYLVERAAFDRSFVLLLAREDAIVLVAGNPGGEVAGYLPRRPLLPGPGLRRLRRLLQEGLPLTDG